MSRVMAAAGNATTGTALAYLFALVLSVYSTAAIMLAAFQQYGIQPGPLLYHRAPDHVWGLLADFFIAMVVLLTAIVAMNSGIRLIATPARAGPRRATPRFQSFVLVRCR